MSETLSNTEKTRVEIERGELADRISNIIKEDGILDIFPGVMLARSSTPTLPMHSVFSPAFCVIAQGGKQVYLGEEKLKYDTGHYLISTMDLPITSCVVEAAENEPYLSFRLELEPALIADVLIESGIELKSGTSPVKAMIVSKIDADLLNAVVRVVRLTDKPGEEKMLLPAINREIVFRLLKGNQAPRLAHLISGGEEKRIAKAIENLREHYDRPLRIENIARDMGMSVSGFHHHFKSVTAMSPLQFQKQIRLQEARRLMLGEDLDAASAGFRVGYEDPSYFSRDYKKQFGAPPQRDIARLRSSLQA
jgi:AraC-like DNA-binding protein